MGNSIVDKLAPKARPSIGGLEGFDADVEQGFADTRARNEAQLLGMAAPRLDMNPETSVFNPATMLTADQQRNARSAQPDPVAVMELQQAPGREEFERANGNGGGWSRDADGALRIEITRGADDLPSSSTANVGVFNEAQASMRDYWTAAQDDADSFLGYASAGIMRSFTLDLDSNPEFFANLSMPTAQYAEPPVRNVPRPAAAVAARDPVSDYASATVGDFWRDGIREASYSGVDRQFAYAFDELLENPAGAPPRLVPGTADVGRVVSSRSDSDRSLRSRHCLADR